MSLVDYASSSGEEEDDKEEEETDKEGVPAKPQLKDREEGKQASGTNGSGPEPQNQNTDVPANVQPVTLPLASFPTIALPDASLLFASPSSSSQQVTGTDHSSRVAAAMSQSASRKRESNGSTLHFIHNKNPRVSNPCSRNAPDGSSGLLPPQLLGRSNVVTEDIGKLFVNKHSGR